MASYRQIHTQIWRDEWFSELPPDEKLLFIYLFSNDSSSLTGLYKLSLRVMSFETGLSQEFITSALDKFESSGRVVYRDGIVWVVHMWRYHSNASPKVQTRIKSDLNLIPDAPIKIAYNNYQNTGRIDMDTVSIEYPYPIALTNLNLTNLNLTENINNNDAIAIFQSNIGFVTPIIAERIKDAEKDYTTEWVCEAIKTGVSSSKGSPNWNYIEAILKNWKANGYKNEKPKGNGRYQPVGTPVSDIKVFHAGDQYNE